MSRREFKENVGIGNSVNFSTTFELRYTFRPSEGKESFLLILVICEGGECFIETLEGTTKYINVLNQ